MKTKKTVFAPSAFVALGEGQDSGFSNRRGIWQFKGVLNGLMRVSLQDFAAQNLKGVCHV